MEKERKLQIIRTALKRFVRHGLNKTTLDEIARDLRIAKATLYHYFTSKDDLYLQTLRFEISRFLDDLKNIFTKDDSELRLKFTEYFTLMTNIENSYRLVYDLLLHIINDAEMVNEKQKEIFNELVMEQQKFFIELLSNHKKREYTADILAGLAVRHGWNTALSKNIKYPFSSEKDDSAVITDLLAPEN